ncbi:hypothetical protein AB4Z14_18400, partial [Terrabacter sp. 2TAF16]|uniref:hypothetical protein n=1 Tax=Terrabacter sp. 2TAF16 TaxID=3233008 RepID=UPI003F979509
MGIFGSQQDNSERYFPVPPAEAFTALTDSVRKRFKLKAADDFTLSCQFSSGASAFTWGENFTAQVVPSQSGSTIRISGVGKVGGQMMQSARTAKLVGQLLDAVTADLRAKRVSTTLENEAIATVENEATQTDWMGDLSGGLGSDPATGCGWCSAASGRTG